MLPLVHWYFRWAPHQGSQRCRTRRSATTEAGAQRTLRQSAAVALILIEAPSSAYHVVCWRREKSSQKRRRPHAILHQQHKFYCGIELHARTMYLCILNQDGEIVSTGI